ncbi:ABC transporter substrate-binding protein [Lonsdalea quercina]|uniref:Peptide/nickel transport system substrate-binding protein n=1 Tax=Lonsdalea quercina TaxID=71657 RepID=A0A1H3Y539_9GAMM|nr:ABC transporter substrate-binding protein [Lonsdalea quercina]SEA06703.1 peptide/nickel transport system substrate-binding protein [Lonsdalea quercina]
MKKWLPVILATVLLASPLLRAATPPNTLVVAISLNGIISLDPAESFETVSTSSLDALYQALVKSDRVNPTQLNPDLATSWQVGADGRSLIFTLDPKATFASGNPVLADDVIYSFTRAVKLNKTPAFILNELGWKPENVDAQFKKRDDHQLEVRWPADIGSDLALRLLSSGVASVVDSKVVSSHSVNDDFGSGWLKNHSAGSGAYQLRNYIPQQALVLTANTHGVKQPKLKQVILKDVADPGARRLLLIQGDADVAYDLGADQFSALANQPGVRISTSPGGKIYYLGFNTQDKQAPTLGNPAFWQAARWLVDYEGISKNLLNGQFIVHQNFLPEGFDGAAKAQPFKLDVDKAKKILSDAGIKSGTRFALTVINQPPYTDIAQALQASFAQADIHIDVQPVVESELWTKMRSRNFQSIFVYWGPDYIDPNTNASTFAYNVPNGPKTLAWRVGWDIPELSRQTQAAAAERDREKRQALYQTLQQEIRERSPFVVMLQGMRLVAVRDNLKDVKQSLANSMLYYDDISK